MAYIKPKNMSWGASPSTDVVSYKVRWAIPPEVIDYNPVTNPGLNVGLVTSVALPLAGMPNIDGELTVGVVGVDDAGNESDPAWITFPFDFQPPAPPVNLVII